APPMQNQTTCAGQHLLCLADTDEVVENDTKRAGAASPCFFFQAEDGIRDGHVTGVQTCALPISRGRRPASSGRRAATGGRAMTCTCDTSAASARRTAARRSGPIRSSAARVASSGFATISTAPSSSARIAAPVPGPAWALTTTMGRGASDMMYPIAPRPSSSGISRSMVTTSGSCWCTLRTASKPSRAVATMRNWPVASLPSTSHSTRRISALSSTTSTLGRRSDDDGIGPHGADLDAPIGHVEPDRPALVTADGLARDGDARGPERLPGRDDVALPHLYRGGRHELCELARPARQLRDQSPWVGAQRLEALDQERHRGLGELRRVAHVAREAFGGEKHVRHG